MDDGMKEVLTVASCGITFILIVGTYYDAAKAYYYPKENVVSYVDCSYEINDMARKLNVTLLDKCILEN
jgi:hypothetical protein